MYPDPLPPQCDRRVGESFAAFSASAGVIVALGVGLGGWAGLLEDGLAGALLGCFFGLIAGLVAALPSASALAFTRLDRSLPVVSIATTIGSAALAFLIDPFVNMLVTIMMMIVLSIVARLLWPFDRTRPNSCKECGYDLRGLDQPARCPECGMLPQPAPTPAA